jgi:hypothetical protein
MYISNQGLQAIHEEMVNDALRRAELRRKLQERETESQRKDAHRAFGMPLTVLVRLMVSVVSRS